MSNAGYAITIHPDSEMGRRGEELPVVVRVDLGEAVLRRRRQMKRVGGAEIERGRGGGEGASIRSRMESVRGGIEGCLLPRPLGFEGWRGGSPVASRLLPDFSKRRGGILGRPWAAVQSRFTVAAWARTSSVPCSAHWSLNK